MTNNFVFFDHLWISLLPILAGSVLGGGLGYFLAFLLQRIFVNHSKWQRVAVLVPWRTGLAVGLLALIVSPVIVINVGIGNTAGILVLGIIGTTVAIPYTCSVFLRQKPSSIYVELTAGARSLAVLLAVCAVIVWWVGGGGAGGLIFYGLQDIASGMLSQGIFIITVIALIFDVLIGGIQFSLTTR